MSNSNLTGAEIAHEGEVDFAKPLARALLRDSRLSFGARGLFAYLWDLPRGWRVNTAHLVTQSPAGKAAIRTLLSELREIKAMRVEEIRDPTNRCLAGSRWVLSSPDRWAIPSPLGKKTESPGIRLSDESTVDEPAAKVLQADGSSIKEAAGTSLVVVLENAQDRLLLELLRTKYPDDRIQAVVHVLLDAGKRPYLSSIQKTLAAQDAAAQRAKDAAKKSDDAAKNPLNKTEALAKLRRCRAEALR